MKFSREVTTGGWSDRRGRARSEPEPCFQLDELCLAHIPIEIGAHRGWVADLGVVVDSGAIERFPGSSGEHGELRRLPVGDLSDEVCLNAG